MIYCLHPKNPHENRDPLISSPGSSNVTSPGASIGAMPVTVDEHVTCHICKYLLQGTLLGDCRVTRWIGSGTFGDVYEAQQLPPLNRLVAIKVMAVEHVADGRAAELFAREVQAIATLDHPSILPVLRVGMVAEGRPYLVMKFAAHGSLQKFCPAVLPPFSLLPTATLELQDVEPGHAASDTNVLTREISVDDSDKADGAEIEEPRSSPGGQGDIPDDER